AHQAAGLAPVHVGQPDVEQHEVEALVPGLLDGLAGGAALGDLELLVEMKLLGQGMAQRGVVVDDQDGTSGHRQTPSCGTAAAPCLCPYMVSISDPAAIPVKPIT